MDYIKSKNTVELNVRSVSKRAKQLYKKYREKDKITERELQALSNAICKSLRIPPVKVTLRGRQPAVMTSSSGRLRTKKKTLGIYNRGSRTINIYKYTAVRNKPITPKQAISTLLHEIMHHYDYEKLKLKKSLHTSGFYIRISKLRELLNS